MEWIGPDRARGYSIMLVVAFSPFIFYYYNLALTPGVDLCFLLGRGVISWPDPTLSYSLSALRSVQTWVPSKVINSLPQSSSILADCQPLLACYPSGWRFLVFAISTLAVSSRAVGFAQMAIDRFCSDDNVYLPRTKWTNGWVVSRCSEPAGASPLCRWRIAGSADHQTQLAILVPIALLFKTLARFSALRSVQPDCLHFHGRLRDAQTFVAFFNALTFQRTVLLDRALQLKMQTVFTQVHLEHRFAAVSFRLRSAWSLATWRCGFGVKAFVRTQSSLCSPRARPSRPHTLRLRYEPADIADRVACQTRSATSSLERAVIGLAFLSPLFSVVIAPLLGFNPG